MNLPIYQIINVRSSQIDDVMAVMHDDINLHRPVALVVKHLDRDQQREVIGLVSNWYAEGRSSPRFPYPIYIVAELAEAVGHIPVVSELAELPKFFSQKEAQTNVKESQIIKRTHLLQQEIRNTDPLVAESTFNRYALNHKKLWFLVSEGDFYEELLTRMKKKAARG